MRIGRGVLAGCALLVLGSCGQDVQPRPDEGSAPTAHPEESRIEREIRTALARHAKVSVEARCPEAGRWEAGKTFICRVTWPGDSGRPTKVPVTMKADGTFDWSIRLAG